MLKLIVENLCLWFTDFITSKINTHWRLKKRPVVLDKATYLNCT